MKLDILTAPTSPETTRSSYVNPHNGLVVNHNIQVILSEIDSEPSEKTDPDNVHNIHIGSIDPGNTDTAVSKAIGMLLEDYLEEDSKPKFAYVYHQVVGKSNDRFHPTPEKFRLEW